MCNNGVHLLVKNFYCYQDAPYNNKNLLNFSVIHIRRFTGWNCFYIDFTNPMSTYISSSQFSVFKYRDDIIKAPLV